ncbi:LysR substrate-binding domain-containing protein [Undibacterium sp. JH2W]|uniref:LysR substrate-binding domain-containing protein n=1 Tax=Undibacterium sp. JH2W TaxID=3413037 RepID=UPI003BF29757
MNLNHLRFASALATSKSFTSAAAMCFVTQPTLSNGILQLEEELGERLFIRTTRTVSLTQFGEHVMPYINDVLSAKNTLSHQAQAFLQPKKRLIRIGTSPLISTKLMGLMIEPYRLKNPEVDIVLREMNMTDLAQMLDKGHLDFVFGVENLQKGPWMRAFLYNEPLLYIPQGGSIKNQIKSGTVRFKDIANQTYVMVPDACGLARATRALFRSHRRKLVEYSGEAMSYQVLEQWAKLGIGSAILPKSKVIASEDSTFEIADKSGETVLLTFEAIWPPISEATSHLKNFAYHLKKLVPEIMNGLHVQ